MSTTRVSVSRLHDDFSYYAEHLLKIETKRNLVEPFRVNAAQRLILDAIGDTSQPAVLAVSDGSRTDDLLCMAIVTRAYYLSSPITDHRSPITSPHLFHPEFFSMHSDTWFSECAFKSGHLIDARQSITFEHLHPLFGKAETDDTYRKGQYRMQSDQRLFRKRLTENMAVAA